MAPRAKLKDPEGGDPEELVAAYARAVKDFERRTDKGAAEVAPGRAILALPATLQARAVVAAYRALPTTGGRYGERIMLGVLITTLLKKKLSFSSDDFVVMVEHAARAWGPAWGPCDYDRAIVNLLAKAKPEVDAKLRRALLELARRRGRKLAEDRKVSDACAALAQSAPA